MQNAAALVHKGAHPPGTIPQMTPVFILYEKNSPVRGTKSVPVWNIVIERGLHGI